MTVPTFDNLFNPLLQALHELGGSASLAEQEEKVAQILNLSSDDLEEIQRGSRTKFSYRLAWARTYLKKYGLLENSSRGVWSLTPKGQGTKRIDKEAVKKSLQSLRSNEKTKINDENLVENEISWEDEVLEILKNMKPDAFERLCQRVLRESGFVQVEISGRSGDGGIDGKGVVKLGSILSFHVIFQCKRHKEIVSSPVVRDFRGAMVGRADKRLIITTGSFTRDARAEALRDGAPPLDLIDGENLVKILGDYQLGVIKESKIVETVSVNKTWFEQF